LSDKRKETLKNLERGYLDLVFTNIEIQEHHNDIHISLWCSSWTEMDWETLIVTDRTCQGKLGVGNFGRKGPLQY
jgi:hypothetical protein